MLSVPSMTGRSLSVSSSQNLPGGYSASGDVVSTTMSQLSLAQAVYARRSEFTRPKDVRIRIGTWNVASFKGTEKDLGNWFIGGEGISEKLSSVNLSDESHRREHEDSLRRGDTNDREGVQEQEHRWSRNQSHATTVPQNDPGTGKSHEDIGIYALGLQEIIDINSAKEALRPYTDPTVANDFKASIAANLPHGYKLIAERQLIGLLLLVYASPTITAEIDSVSTTSVGTGLMGYMGNKGAVTSRIVLGETTRLVFINSHLSAGTGKEASERRNWDASQILTRTAFDPIQDDCGITHPAEKIGDEDFAFWFGDLNYRLDGIPSEDVRRLLMLHTRNEYDIGQGSERKIEQMLAEETNAVRQQRQRSSTESSRGSGSTVSGTSHDPRASTLSSTALHNLDEAMATSSDPMSLQTTIDSLLPHDELHEQQRLGKMFHDGWQEGPITFLPTYKYDRGAVGVFDSGDKRRGPSWCDRILYRSRQDRTRYDEKVYSTGEARKRDETMKAQGLDKAAEDESTLFDYDPEADGDNEYSDNGSASTAVDKPGSTTVTKEGYEDSIKLEQYTSHQRVLSSDHKPLVADFTLTYQATIPSLKAKIQREVARELDKAENEGRPVITMVIDGSTHDGSPEFDGVDFGKLKFDDERIRTVTIANTGRVPAMFGFGSRPDAIADTVSKWVSVHVDLASVKEKPSKEDAEWFSGVQKAFTIHPGDSTTVSLTAHVSDKDLVKTIEDHESLEDVLILRVKDGRDHFLPVRATWHKSGLHGKALEKLDRLVKWPEGGLRKLQNQHPIGSWSRGSRDSERLSLEEERRP